MRAVPLFAPPGDVPADSPEGKILARLWRLARRHEPARRAYWRVVEGMPANGSRYGGKIPSRLE